MTSLHVDTPVKSVFVEHLEEQGPSLEQLEAYDCLNPGSPGQQRPKRPTFDTSSRRSSLPPPTTSFSSLYSPPQSPRIPLAQASANVFLPGLVRRLSHVKDKEHKRRKDRNQNNNNNKDGGEVEDVDLALSPRLARAHPSPRPTRRYSSHGSSNNKSASSRDLQGSGFVTRRNMKREIVFSDEKLLDDAKAVLEGLLDEASLHNNADKRPPSTTPPPSTFLKLNDTPNTSSTSSLNGGRPSSILLRNPFFSQSMVMPQSPTSVISESILRSPVEERRMSFELARAQQAASISSSPIRVLNIPRNSLSSSTTSHNNVRAPSPLGERAPSRASFDSARDGRPSWAELNLPERRGSAPIVPTVAHLQREEELARRSFNKFHHPLSKSVSAAAPMEQSTPQQSKKRGSIISLAGDKTKDKPERPFYARRSFSASFLNLGKLVTGLASSSSSSRQPSSSTSATSADSPLKDKPSTPSFKVNSVTKVDSTGGGVAGHHGINLLGSPSPRTSMSGSRPSSPLVTADPVLASDESIDGEIVADTSSDLGETPSSQLNARNARRLAGVSEDGLLSPSFKVDSRPSLSRNAKSDDGTPRRATAHPATMLSTSSSPILNGFHGLRSPSRTSSPSPNLTKIPEVADENWTASIRGVNASRGRRMSAADLFAPIQQVSLPSIGSGDSQSPAKAGKGGTDMDELDFTKKPISALAGFSSISLDHLPLLPASSSTSSIARMGPNPVSIEPRQRATSYSSLLSASRPATPASSPQHHQLHSLNLHHSQSKTATPTPRIVGSPSPAMRTSSARSHRHTQSLPTPVPASSVLNVADVSGRDTSVLEASHAKFVAALTVAATSSTTSPTSKRSSRTSRLSFSAKNKKDIKRALWEAGNEDAIDSSSDEEAEEEHHLALPDLDERRGRLPKLSYGGESLTERSDLSGSSPPSFSASLPTSTDRTQSTPSRASSSFIGFRQPEHPSSVNHNNLAEYGLSPNGKSRRQDNTSTESTDTVVSSVHSGDSHKEDDVFSKVAVW